MNPDVIVIGAGAAGLQCARTAGGRGRRVVVLDHATTLGEKIRISGGGRCNFTHLGARPEHYLSANPHFCRSALARYTPRDFLALVDHHGIPWHEKTPGQLFCDRSAQDIIDLLLNECADGGVDLYPGTRIEAVERAADGYALRTSRGDFFAPALVIASGGLTVPKLGATGFGFDLARQFGVPVRELRPALVPLTLQPEELAWTAALAGVSLPVEVHCGAGQFRDSLLFTHRGLSGPAILQISSYWRPGEAITVNLLPGQDVPAQWRDSGRGGRGAAEVLERQLPHRLAQAFAARYLAAGRVADWSADALRQAAQHLSAWAVRPNGSEGYRKAEVTLGGVDTHALSSQTMAVKNQPGLYFIGECVDVTGWLGGYNFQMCWSQGHVAGLAV